MSAKEQAVVEQHGELELNDDNIRDYLKNHGDFLQRHPDLLDYLQLSHGSGSAVSLVEKQANVLRERNTELRQQLKILTGNARHNDILFERTRTLLLQLLDARSREDLYETFMRAMPQDFDIEHVSMILYGNDTDPTGWRSETREAVKEQIGALFPGHKPVCGTVREKELTFLFPDGTSVGSAALAPLVEDGEQLGLIAVGSADANRYSSKVDTLFLTHIAEVMVKLMSRLPGTAA